MSLSPEYVPQIQEMLAHLRSATRIGEAMLREIRETPSEYCGMCGGRGVVLEGAIDHTGTLPSSRPCNCVKGAPFRAAAAMQRAKQVGREKAAGD